MNLRPFLLVSGVVVALVLAIVPGAGAQSAQPEYRELLQHAREYNRLQAAGDAAAARRLAQERLPSGLTLRSVFAGARAIQTLEIVLGESLAERRRQPATKKLQVLENVERYNRELAAGRIGSALAEARAGSLPVPFDVASGRPQPIDVSLRARHRLHEHARRMYEESRKAQSAITWLNHAEPRIEQAIHDFNAAVAEGDKKNALILAGLHALPVDCDAATGAPKPIQNTEATRFEIAGAQADHTRNRRPIPDDICTTRLRRVTAVHKRQASVTIRLAFENGVKVEATPEHPFLVQGRGWSPAGSLRLGDFVRTEDGWTALAAAETLRHNPPIDVYNLTVEEDHTYFVGGDGNTPGILVHNADPESYRLSLAEQLPEVLDRLRQTDSGFPGILSIFKPWLNNPTKRALDIDKALNAGASLDDAGMERILLEKAMVGSLLGDMIDQQNAQFRKGMEYINAELPRAESRADKAIDELRKIEAGLNQAMTVAAALERDATATPAMRQIAAAQVRAYEQAHARAASVASHELSSINRLRERRTSIVGQHVTRIQSLARAVEALDTLNSAPASRGEVNAAVDRLPITEVQRAAIRAEINLARLAVDRAYGVQAITDAGDLGKAGSSVGARPGQHIETTSRVMANATRFQAIEAFKLWAEAHCENTAGRRCPTVPEVE